MQKQNITSERKAGALKSVEGRDVSRQWGVLGMVGVKQPPKQDDVRRSTGRTCRGGECPHSTPTGCFPHLCLEKVWLCASKGLLSHHPGPRKGGPWPLPPADSMGILGRNSKTMEGCGGREEFFNPAQLASGI